jgi:hypothetical protein
MPNPSEQPLKPNPFTTYRDPKTGLWIVEPASQFLSNQGKVTFQLRNSEAIAS